MRVGFAGTPAFAAYVLDALLAESFEVAIVLTQPDRPRGRGLRLEPPPVKALAVARSLPVLQPVTLKSEAAQAELRAVALDVLVVVAYGLLLPRAILDWPRYGCVNVHASLLPRWRGAAPIQHALIAGDVETGVTLMRMDEGLDTGPSYGAERVTIAPRETAGTLHDKLQRVGAQALVALLKRLAQGETVAATPQPREGVTLAPKITNADTVVAWQESAQRIDRQVRALNPLPGAVTTFHDKRLKIVAAEPVTNERAAASPGVVLETMSRGVVVACGDGALELLEVQPAGGRPMSAAAFVAGRHIVAGERFD